MRGQRQFLSGALEGMGVLDGMRAVANFKDTLDLSSAQPMIVGTGYSGGAIATGWAASLQPSYAPELDIKGWAHGGTPANLTGTLLYINNTPFSGFIPVLSRAKCVWRTVASSHEPYHDREGKVGA